MMLTMRTSVETIMPRLKPDTDRPVRTRDLTIVRKTKSDAIARVDQTPMWKKKTQESIKRRLKEKHKK